jgi:NAD(P)-dependent dehydrogenase (short-subunit alcohol dehydrogenase family)
MKIRNTVALVTGANRGIGLAFTQELLARGARKVYAGARDPSSIKHSGVEALRLDVTKPEEIAAAAAHASDVTLLINNAAILSASRLIAHFPPTPTSTSPPFGTTQPGPTPSPFASSRRAATLRPGSNPRSSRKRCVQAFGHCVHRG